MSHFIVPYASLAQLKRELKETAAQDADDQFLMESLRHCSGRIRTTHGYSFLPSIATELLSAIQAYQSPVWELPMEHPLLEVQSVTDGNGNTLTIWDKTPANRATSDFLPVPPNSYPKLALRSLGTEHWRQVTGEWQGFAEILITGIWGWHSEYDNAYLWTGDTVQDDPLTDTATQITVTATGGADALALSPRFSPGQLLLVEEEWMLVVSVDSATQITVMRAMNGSSAASHAQDTPISYWMVEPSIVRALAKWTSYLYNRRGAYKRVTFDGLSATEFPPDAPEEVQAILNEFPTLVAWQVVDDSNQYF